MLLRVCVCVCVCLRVRVCVCAPRTTKGIYCNPETGAPGSLDLAWCNEVAVEMPGYEV